MEKTNNVDLQHLVELYESENRKLRYERLMFKAQYVRSQISRDAFYSWLTSGYIKSMPHKVWVNRLVAIAEAYEARAAKLKEQK